MQRKMQEITLLSSRFCRASFPVLSLISTLFGWEMSVCRSMTRPSLFPLQAESASKSRVLLSDEPSTGQNMPQNFCRGLAGLSEPILLKKAGTSPAVDMPTRRGGCCEVSGGVATQMLKSIRCLFSFFFSFFFSSLSSSRLDSHRLYQSSSAGGRTVTKAEKKLCKKANAA